MLQNMKKLNTYQNQYIDSDRKTFNDFNKDAYPPFSVLR